MKKVNYFDADRTMSLRVAEFMRCHVWKTEIRLRYAESIKKAEEALELIDNLKGSIHESQIGQMKTEQLAKIASLTKERDALIAEEATFELSFNDKQFKKAVKADSTFAENAIINWFKAYHLDVSDTALVDEILSATGEKISNRTLVNSRGKVATAFNDGNCLKMLYAKAYEHMVNAGTIKPVQIPSLMMDKYDNARRQARKASKKSSK